MSLYVDLSINDTLIAGVTITRHLTNDNGVHEYAVYYAATERNGRLREIRVRLLHIESDGAIVLASKALGEIQRLLQLERAS